MKKSRMISTVKNRSATEGRDNHTKRKKVPKKEKDQRQAEIKDGLSAYGQFGGEKKKGGWEKGWKGGEQIRERRRFAIRFRIRKRDKTEKFS